MKLKFIFILLLLVFFQIDCKKSNKSDKTDSAYFDSNSDQYVVLAKANTIIAKVNPDGFLGLVSIFAKHEFVGLNKKDKKINFNIVFHGVGNVISKNGKIFVLTARHVLVYSPDDITKNKFEYPKEGEVIECKKLKSIESEVLIGGLGVAPEKVYVSTVSDFCVFAIANEDVSFLMDSESFHKDHFAPISLEKGRVKPEGRDKVEVWGYPDMGSARVDEMKISSIKDTHIDLNKAMKPGYSGGPVFKFVQGKPEFIGIITRSTKKGDATKVIANFNINEILNSIENNKQIENIIRVNKNEKTELFGINFHFK